MADWFLRCPDLWRVYAWLAAGHPPVMTVMRGRPWEDCC